MPAGDDDLGTLEDLKTHLGVSGTGEDTLLQALLTELSLYAQDVLMRGRRIRTLAVTEYHDGDGSDRLYVRRRPITAVSALYLDEGGHYGQGENAFAAATQLTAGSDFAIARVDQTEDNRGLIMALPALGLRSFARGTDAAGFFPRGRGNIKVTYTAGYSATPQDLKLAVAFLVAAARKGIAEGGIKAGETIGKYSYYLMSKITGDPTLMVAANTFERYAVRAV